MSAEQVHEILAKYCPPLTAVQVQQAVDDIAKLEPAKEKEKTAPSSEPKPKTRQRRSRKSA